MISQAVVVSLVFDTFSAQSLELLFLGWCFLYLGWGFVVSEVLMFPHVQQTDRPTGVFRNPKKTLSGTMAIVAGQGPEDMKLTVQTLVHPIFFPSIPSRWVGEFAWNRHVDGGQKNSPKIRFSIHLSPLFLPFTVSFYHKYTFFCSINIPVESYRYHCKRKTEVRFSMSFIFHHDIELRWEIPS